ncbi:MAG TPA: DUF6069 family protein [Jatrophihabitantaceae bacterium]
MTNSSLDQPGTIAGRVDARSLWTGGLAAAIVAVLLAITGIVVARGVFHVPVLAPQSHGTWGSAHTPTYAAFAFVATLVATGLIYLLVLFSPQPFAFFGWIMATATVLAAAEPFTTNARLSARVATATINIVLGLAIWSLVSGSARRSQPARVDNGRLPPIDY